MSSKNKRGKKKFKAGNDKGKDGAPSKIYTYFTNEEIAEIRTILKTKDISGVPVVVAATVLCKFHILKSLVKEGYNVNQTGQNNMTALIWAVKLKYINFVDYLVANGGDPTIRSDSGDNVLILALENKLWDEEAFINFWKLVRKKNCIDVNSTNKSGHNMLHMCVRREWENALDLLVAEKPNVDNPNCNGVTPLMLACFRTNPNIIQALIKAGADILRKDNHGRMPLCYVIASSMKSKPPFPGIEKVLNELNKKSSFTDYLRGTLDLIIATAKKSEISTSSSDTLVKIIKFSVQYNNGVKVLLSYDTFKKLKKVLEVQIKNSDLVRFILEIWNEICFYNEESFRFDYNFYQIIRESFIENKLHELCVQMLYLNLAKIDQLVFNLILLTFQENESFVKLVEEHSKLLQEFANGKYYNNLDEGLKIKIINEQKEKLKVFLNKLNNKDEQLVPQKATESRNLKKTRRRAKAIKAKLSKIKTVELSKRLSLGSRKANQFKQIKQRSKLDDEFDQKLEVTHRNPILYSFQHMFEHPSNEDLQSKRVYFGPCKDWKEKIRRTISHFPTHYPFNTYKVEDVVDTFKKQSVQKFDSHSINAITNYLNEIMGFLIKKYKEHWEQDRKIPVCFCEDESNECHCQRENLEDLEHEIVVKLRYQFDELLRNIKLLLVKNPQKAFELFKEIEEMIFHHEIRKIKLMLYMGVKDSFNLDYITEDQSFIKNEANMLQHLQNVLNDIEMQKKNVRVDIVENYDSEDIENQTQTASEIYYKDMAQVSKPSARNKRTEIEAKLNTIANGFHLINSTMKIVEDPEEKITNYRVYCITDLNYPIRTQTYQKSYIFYQEELTQFVPRRLNSQVSSLQSAQTYQRLLNGNIRISMKEQRLHYVISAGTNFNAVELGLDVNNEPLAVKRIQRQSWVGKIIKTLIEPLLGLCDTNILPYFACEYEGDELILATPLCKCNIHQYLQLLRQNNELPKPGELTNMEIIKQFLDGLLVLHKYEIPIIHGNLKPSNVFIDFNGVVKIAEFGIHKALYKIIEPPNGSLMWFAKETLDIYRSSSIVECSTKSDIQVAGMFIYFVLTCGTHAFGDEIEEIIKNIQGGITKLKIRNYDLRDLLMWMLLSDFNARPNIDQVLMHPVFWMPAKKWAFVLACAGVSLPRYIIPINISKLYRSIDTFADPYIKVDWQALIRIKLPQVKLNDQNCISGLLRFIRYCYENQDETEIGEARLNDVITSLFPTLPVALYRTLQNTNWFKHPIFIQFVAIY